MNAILLSICFLTNFQPSSSEGDTLFITLNAYNLSEDMSVLSTMNDEIIFQLYERDEDADILKPPVLSRMFLFDEVNRSMRMGVNKALINPEKEYLLFLLEWDEKRSEEQRVSVIRIYHNEIEKLYQNNNREELKKYLATDDLLGLQKIKGSDLLGGLEIEYKGILNADKFRYKLLIE